MLLFSRLSGLIGFSHSAEMRSLPPVFDDEFRDQNGDLAVRTLAFDLEDVLDQRLVVILDAHQAIDRKFAGDPDTRASV